MLMKVEPYEHGCQHGATTTWSPWIGTWSAANGVLVKTDAGAGEVSRSTTDASNEARFDYRFTSTGGADYGVVRLRVTSGGDDLAIVIRPTTIDLDSTVSGVTTNLGSATVSTTANEWYTIRAEADGGNVTVWRSTAGALETQILSTTTATPTTTSAIALGISNSTSSTSPFEFDNLRILADDLDNSYSFAYNNANELTSMAGPNGTTSFTYDAWGRQVTQTLNSVTDSYAYRYGSKLYSVDLANDSILDVVFDYGGDQKRRTTTEGANTMWYNWNATWNVVNEEDGTGTLTQTYLHDPQNAVNATLAHVDGTNPSTGAYVYYGNDHLGSTQSLYNHSRLLVAKYDYSRYGEDFTSRGTASTNYRYTGHCVNPQSGLYYALARYYSPNLGRWTQRDPIGFADGPNLYAYVNASPINYLDPSGDVAMAVLCGGRWVVNGLVVSTCYSGCPSRFGSAGSALSAYESCDYPGGSPLGNWLLEANDFISAVYKDVYMHKDYECVWSCYWEAMGGMNTPSKLFWTASGFTCGSRFTVRVFNRLGGQRVLERIFGKLAERLAPTWTGPTIFNHW